jgi:hypothetical protein
MTLAAGRKQAGPMTLLGPRIGEPTLDSSEGFAQSLIGNREGAHEAMPPFALDFFDEKVRGGDRPRIHPVQDWCK